MYKNAINSNHRTGRTGTKKSPQCGIRQCVHICVILTDTRQTPVYRGSALPKNIFKSWTGKEIKLCPLDQVIQTLELIKNRGARETYDNILLILWKRRIIY